MANYTPNLQLEKPLGTEYYDIAVHNSNSDKIEGMYNDLWKIRAKLIGNDTTYTDLNTIYAAGFYRSASINNLFNNLPPGCSASFNLSVENISDNNRYGKQWIGNHGTNEFWHRTNTSFTIDTPTWTAWEKVITTADVINNLISTSATLPLSAGQGKILQDTKADKTIKIVAGNGLIGGGDLTSNKTLNVASANVGILINEDSIELKPTTKTTIGGTIVGNGLTVGLDGKIDIVSSNDGIIVNANNITVDTINNLTTASTTQPLSANQGKILSESKADKTTQIVAGNGLTGGGDISASRTLNIVSANDGIIANADNIQLDTQNVLTSTAVNKPLSANMGKVLQDTKLSLTGGTLSGALNTYSIVDNATNIGKVETTFTTITNGEWAKPIGFSIMAKPDSYGAPSGFAGGYWNILGRRDINGGYTGILTDGISSPVRAFLGASHTTADPTFKQFVFYGDNIGTGATNYAAGNHDHSSYVKKSGDTMTGNLTVPNIIADRGTFSGDITAPNIITNTSIGTYTTLFSGTQQCGQNTWKDTGIDIPTTYSSVLIGVNIANSGLYDTEIEFSRCALTRGQTLLFAHQTQTEGIMGKIIGDRLWTYTSANSIGDNNLKTVIGITRR